MTEKPNTTYVVQCVTCGVLGHMCVNTVSGHHNELHNLLEIGREHKKAHSSHAVTMTVTHSIVEKPMGRLR